jgi:hypothetical protein
MNHTFICTAALSSLLLLSACSNQTTDRSSSKNQQDSQTTTDHNKTNDSEPAKPSDSEPAKPSDSETNDPEQQSETSKDVNLTQAEVIQAVKKQINTNLSIKLPSQLPLQKNHHLTAVTKSNTSSYEVAFYESKEPIPINNSKLTNSSDVKKIAIVKAIQYPSEKEAKTNVNYQPLQTGTPKIDLGFGIDGYKDAGAGSAFTTWHEGRWSMIVRNRNNEEDNAAGLKMAKEIVKKLEKQLLPIPHQIGAGSFNTNKENGAEANRIAWQEKTIVYEVSMSDPFQLVDTITQHFDKMK